MKTKCIELIINDETTYVPLMENIDNYSLDNFDELKEKWEADKWCYYHSAEVNLTTVDIENPQDLVKCDEFDIWLFKSLAIQADWYMRPFDEEPRTMYFTNMVAQDGMFGNEYSKDFAFFI